MTDQQRRPIVLCVDDEARVVESLALSLRKAYEVHTAASGEEGLRKLKELPGVAVVVSDMRMPAMDGATFLKRVMRAQPDVSRILLTGDPGRDAAVLAVNEGQIFRFLTKPCPPDQLKAAIDAAVMQHRLMHAERSILQETLIGCIRALIDVLAITNPVAFGRASRVRRQAMSFAAELGCPDFWQLDAASMLSQLGYLSLPVELVEKLYYGERLTSEEQALADAVPHVASKLLGHIPRLEPVLQILAALNASDAELRVLGEGTIGLGARILALVLDHDSLVAQGHGCDVAMQAVRSRAARYGESLIERFAAFLGAASGSREIHELPLRLVQPGMTLMEDLRTQMGTLLVPRGFEITPTFLERLRNFGSGMLAEKIKVLVPAPQAGAGSVAG
ncbi:HD domain-containing phosphohydrolase [Peristeroidobacter soli]|uniref:HD domain-containing phosphohydrolase n=1 Tax=Peristeroidobacter soli TaxID=2497877 RepID=UPI001300A7C7|nr:HD domain-containing phosphohydrolase [Peristeroidobacter soli]